MADDWDFARYQAEVRTALMTMFEGISVEELSSDMNRLPIHTRMDFPDRWEIGKSPPGGDPLCIFGLFEGEVLDGDIRAYVFPRAGADPTHRMWFRYTLSRAGAVPVVEAMVRETFVSEVAEQWSNLLDDGDGAEPEAPAGPTETEH